MEKIKKAIMEHFARHHVRVGEVFPKPPINIRNGKIVISDTEMQKFEPALYELKEEGLLDFREDGEITLTKKGFESIYPADKEDLKIRVMNHFQNTKASVGHFFHGHSFFYKNGSPQLNHREIEVLSEAINELAEEGLVEIEGENEFKLTQKGSDEIYK